MDAAVNDLAVAVTLMGVLALALAILVVLADREALTLPVDHADDDAESHQWESVAVYDEDAGTPFGYKVRWSQPDDAGRYPCVGHYHAGEDDSPSLVWCERAAESHARRLNAEGRRPEGRRPEGHAR